MGVKGLVPLILKIAGSKAIKEEPFSKFKGMKVSVDLSLMLYKVCIGIRETGKDMVNQKGELTSHLYALFYKTLVFLRNGVIPIYVLDGSASNLKANTIDKRKEIKNRALEKLETLSDSEDEEYIKNFTKTFSLTKQNMVEAKILMDLMGVPYIEAPGEADDICAWLAARNDTDNKPYVNGVCSDDLDMLVLGAPYLFKNMLSAMNSTAKKVQVISLKKTLEHMKLTMKQFVDMAPFLETDYCDRINKLGPVTAYKLISEHRTLKKVFSYLKTENKYGFNEENDPTISDGKMTIEKCYTLARDRFLNALTEIDKSDNFVLTDDNLHFKQFQREEIIDFMCNKHGFDIFRIQNGLDKLGTYYNQMGITRENNKKVHKISKNQRYKKSFESTVEILSSESEEDSEEIVEIPSKKNPSAKK